MFATLTPGSPVLLIRFPAGADVVEDGRGLDISGEIDPEHVRVGWR